MSRFVTFAVAFCFAAAAYAQQGAAPYDVLVRSAKIYVGYKDFDKAQMFLDSAVNNYPEQPEAHYWLGSLLHDRADFTGMMEQFRKFDEIYSKAKATNDKKLVKACEKDDTPKQIGKYKLSAFAKSSQEGVKQLKLADSLAKEIRNLPDDSATAEQGKQVQALYDKARSLFELCLAIDDTISGVYTNLGLVEGQRGNLQAALDLYRKAHQLSPKDKELLFSLASTHFKLASFDSAAHYYGAFADEDSLNREAALINQAMCYQALKDEPRLEGTLDRILQVNPQNADILYQRGVLNIRKASSRTIADSAATLDSLAALHSADKALEKAKADLLSYRLGFYKKALPDFKAAAELTKTDPDYWYWYGNAAMFSDKMDEARGAYSKCIEIKPDSQDCWCSLEVVYAKLKMLKEMQEAAVKCGKK
jgi:tetratricopeptide (TPR) repeat protein